ETAEDSRVEVFERLRRRRRVNAKDAVGRSDGERHRTEQFVVRLVDLRRSLPVLRRHPLHEQLVERDAVLGDRPSGQLRKFMVAWQEMDLVRVFALERASKIENLVRRVAPLSVAPWPVNELLEHQVPPRMM